MLRRPEFPLGEPNAMALLYEPSGAFQRYFPVSAIARRSSGRVRKVHDRRFLQGERDHALDATRPARTYSASGPMSASRCSTDQRRRKRLRRSSTTFAGVTFLIASSSRSCGQW